MSLALAAIPWTDIFGIAIGLIKKFLKASEEKREKIKKETKIIHEKIKNSEDFSAGDIADIYDRINRM